MKVTLKNRPQSAMYFRNLDPDCSNLQSVRRPSSLIHNGFLKNSRLLIPDCGEVPQSGKHPNKSTTYVNFQIAGTPPLPTGERDQPRWRGLVSFADASMLGGQGGVA